MDARTEGSATAVKKRTTTAERKSDREMVVTRSFDAPPRIVFEAWTKPELFSSGGCPSHSA